MNLGTAQVIRANARDLPLADNSVDLVVTSPPYFALRSYQDGGEHYAGQIGDEPTAAEFVASLLEVTRECVRVLKPSGSLWVNLGDKYSGAPSGPQGASGGLAATGYGDRVGGRRKVRHDIPAKSLIGIPWRYALACIDDLGLILRAEVIWSKPNGLPESVTDRVRRSHEQWFYFEQDSGSVEPLADALPLCDLCGRPVDARATLVSRLKELEGDSQPFGVPDHVWQDRGRELADSGRGDDDVAVGSRVPPVPSVCVGDAEGVEQSVELVEDGVVAAVDHDPKDGPAVVGMTDEADCTLTVDQTGEPSGICECERHALTLNDEPWIPQSLAAELMQMVADGEADPQSVADFLSGDYARTHSTWFHFTLEPRYFSAVDEIREAHSPNSTPQTKRVTMPSSLARIDRQTEALGNGSAMHPLGKLPGSVWTVPTEPLRVPDHLGIDHFAAFPTEWPRRIIQGWSPAGVCVDCGEGRRPVSVGERVPTRPSGAARIGASMDSVSGVHRVRSDVGNVRTDRAITGYACGCPELGNWYHPDGTPCPHVYPLTNDWPAPPPGGWLTCSEHDQMMTWVRSEPAAPTRPAVVLDPFGGTGTTALVAKALGRHGITVDMSADYCRLAEWRTNDRDQLAKVLGVAKAGPADDAQLDLFGEPA